MYNLKCRAFVETVSEALIQLHFSVVCNTVELYSVFTERFKLKHAQCFLESPVKMQKMCKQIFTTIPRV